jgi:hypothetical protein
MFQNYLEGCNCTTESILSNYIWKYLVHEVRKKLCSYEEHQAANKELKEKECLLTNDIELLISSILKITNEETQKILLKHFGEDK